MAVRCAQLQSKKGTIEMYVVAVEFRIKADHVYAFREVVLRQAKNSLTKEEQCRQFDVCFDPKEKSRVFLYELYDNRAAFDHHCQTEHFAQFSATVKDWIESKIVSHLERAEPA